MAFWWLTPSTNARRHTSAYEYRERRRNEVKFPVAGGNNSQFEVVPALRGVTMRTSIDGFPGFLREQALTLSSRSRASESARRLAQSIALAHAVGVDPSCLRSS